MGNAYGDLKDLQKQKDLLERSLVVVEQHRGPKHPDVTGALYYLSNAFGDLGDYQKEKDLLELCLKIQGLHYGPEHLVAHSLCNLGDAVGKLELLERRLKIKEKNYGPEGRDGEHPGPCVRTSWTASETEGAVGVLPEDPGKALRPRALQHGVVAVQAWQGRG